MTDEPKTADPKPDAGPSIAELQAQLQEVTGKLNKYETDVASLKTENEKLKKAKKERDDRLSKDAEGGDKEAMERVKTELRNEFVEREERLKKDVEARDSELKQLRVTGAAMTKAATIFNADSLELIEGKVNRFCDWQDGKIVIKDDKGEIRYSETNPRMLMGLDEFLKELAGKHPSIAIATGKQGAQQEGTKRQGNNTNAKDYSVAELMRASPEEQNRMIQEGSPDAAKAFLRSVKIR